MGRDALIAAIEAEGRERAGAILAEAEAEAQALRTRAARAASLERDQELARAERELRAAAQARLAAARSETLRRVLAARDALLARLFARAGELLDEALDSDAARAALAARARAALELVPPGPLHVACSEAARDTLEAELAGRDDVTLECDPDMPPGFRIRAADGALLIDASLPRLLEHERPRLAIEALQRIERGAG